MVLSAHRPRPENRGTPVAYPHQPPTDASESGDTDPGITKRQGGYGRAERGDRDLDSRGREEVNRGNKRGEWLESSRSSRVH